MSAGRERQQQTEALNLGQLFDPAYSEPVDTSGQVTRIPGTPDAACMCGQDVCRWPWDIGCWPTNEEEPDE